VCMTGLCPERALVYWKSRSPTARAMRENAGIQKLFPGWEIVDSDFEPCGYSMNGLLGEAFANIHITPEDGFSYASVELCGLNPAEANAKIALIAEIFRPQQLVVALSSQAADDHAEQDVAAAAAETALAKLARKPGSLAGGLTRNGGATWTEAAHVRVMYQRFLSPSALRIPSRCALRSPTITLSSTNAHVEARKGGRKTRGEKKSLNGDHHMPPGCLWEAWLHAPMRPRLLGETSRGR
jgi:S-adenosylmethionine/arginine decarboxylase-like enzyme